MSYETIIKEVDLNSNIRFDLELLEEITQIEEVIIVADRLDQNVSSTEMSVNQLAEFRDYLEALPTKKS